MSCWPGGAHVCCGIAEELQLGRDQGKAADSHIQHRRKDVAGQRKLPCCLVAMNNIANKWIKWIKALMLLCYSYEGHPESKEKIPLVPSLQMYI